MTKAIKFLEYILSLNKKIDTKRYQLEKLHDRLTSLSVPTDKEQVSHTRNLDIMGETIALIIQLEKQLDMETKELVAMQIRAEVYFDLLLPENSLILRERYSYGTPIEEMAKNRGLSDRQVYRLIHKAADELEPYLPDNVCDVR